MNNQYYAVRRQDGIILLPISKEAVYVSGVIYPNGIMNLIHPHKYQEMKIVNKVDEYGKNSTTKNGTELKERRNWEYNFDFNLVGDEINWFLDSYVGNAEDVKLWMQPATGHQHNPEGGADSPGPELTIENTISDEQTAIHP